jgi:hypothetical protein
MDAVDAERWAGHRIVHEMEQQALKLAREDVNRRLGEMNQLREQITTERGAYPTRVEYDAKHDQLVQRVQTIETQFAALTGRLTVMAALAGVAVSVIVTVVLKLVNV